MSAPKYYKHTNPVAQQNNSKTNRNKSPARKAKLNLSREQVATKQFAQKSNLTKDEIYKELIMINKTALSEPPNKPMKRFNYRVKATH